MRKNAYLLAKGYSIWTVLLVGHFAENFRKDVIGAADKHADAQGKLQVLRSMLPMLSSVQFCTVTPASSSGLTLASGVILPVRPKFRETDSSFLTVATIAICSKNVDFNF